jgi:glucokinase
MKKTYLGVDLGGTYVKCGLVDARGRILRRDRFPVDSRRGPEATIADIVAHLEGIIEGLPLDEKPSGLALGAAGLIEVHRGILIKAPNLPGWNNVPLRDLFSARLDMPVRLENDANLHALGEWHSGAAKDWRHFILITLGTGVGGGLVLNSRLWNGTHMSVAEIGHMTVDPHGPVCACGNNGCLETYASATAMCRMARERYGHSGKTPDVFDSNRHDASDLFKLADQGDETAKQVFHQAGWALGLALANVFNLLGLEGAVIGGGASAAFEFMHPALIAEFSKRVMTVDPRSVHIRKTALDNDAPLAASAVLFK